MLAFEWDDAKNQKNLARHGIDFDTAARVFDDPRHVLFLDRVVEGEVRWQAIGFVRGKLITVVHTYPDAADDNLIRMISARRATSSEREVYDQENA